MAQTSVQLSGKNKVAALLKKYGIIFVLFLMIVVITMVRPEFITPNNLFNVLTQSSIYGIMAIGLTFVIIAKGIDLSVGSVLALSGVIMASFSQAAGSSGKMYAGLPMLPIFLVILIALAVGAVCGAVSGFFVAKTGIHAFIATLGMMTIARGLALIYTNGKPLSNLNPTFSKIGGKIFGFLPMPVVIYAIVIVVSWIVLNNTRFGKSVYAIGANSAAAEISGINVARNQIIIFAISGMLAGLAAVVFSGRTLSAQPGAATGYELTAIAATTIGGTSQTGGIGTIWGAVAGALVLGVLRNGLTLMGVHAYWQQVIEGAIIIGAVVIDMRKNARKA